MKTLFFIAALVAAVFLVMQTPAGQSWLEDSEPKLNIQQKTKEIQEIQKVSSRVAQLVETKVTKFAQQLNQTQQTQIDQLENRIAELENELIMGRIANKMQPADQPAKAINLAIDNPAEEKFVPLPTPQGITQGVQSQNTQLVTTDRQMQRNRQARLQDIAEKMEMSSLQALVN